jgi:hypothetical protein
MVYYIFDLFLDLMYSIILRDEHVLEINLFPSSRENLGVTSR